MADAAKPEKLTLGEAITDLGFFPILFTVAVGGPSILAILEQVLVNHQLVPALQWIVDGYNRVMTVLGAAVEPLIQPAIDWVNAQLGWSLTLAPVWRPVFALCMVAVMAQVRTAVREGDVAGAAGIGSLLSIGFLASALLIGLFAAGPGWLAQGAVAAAPFAIYSIFSLVAAAWFRSRGDWRNAGPVAVFFGAFSLVQFAAGAGLSLMPGLAQSGGLIALGLAFAMLGVATVALGLSVVNRSGTRQGLTMLGGFIAAGLILAADFALKALGAG
jgi:hypothetical protein